MASPTNTEILLFPGTFGVGGIERVVSVLASAWADERAVSILTFENPDLRPFFPVDPRVRFVPLGHVSDNIRARNPRAYLHAVRQIFRLRRALRARTGRGSPPVLISFLAYYNVIARLASLGLGVTHIVTEHTALRADSWILKILRAVVYPFSDGVVVLTPSALPRLPAWLRRKTTVIPNPVTAPVPASSPASAGRPYVLAVGRLAQEKRFDVLLDAFDLVRDECPEWDLRIAGDGPLRDELSRDIARRGLTARVSLLGNVSAMENLYGGAALFVLSSDDEGFSLALCEAMEAGLPVLARDYGPVLRELVHDRVDGWIAKRNGAVSLANEMRHLMRRPELRSRLGQAAAAARGRHAPDRVLPRWASLFRRLGDPVAG